VLAHATHDTHATVGHSRFRFSSRSIRMSAMRADGGGIRTDDELNAARDVPFVPTDDAVVAAMLRLAAVTPDDVLYDLGCGDGRIVIAAAKRYGARGVGVDIDPRRIVECRENAARAGVGDRVAFLEQSFFEVDLRPASVLALYLLPSMNIRLRPKMLAEMRPGSRVVSNHFEIGDWRADVVEERHHRRLQKWVVPADVGGEWHCTVNDPAEGRRRVVLKLKQRFQIVTGWAAVGGRETMIGHGRVAADRLTFRLVEWGRGGAIMWYGANVAGRAMRGHCWPEGRDAERAEFGGARV
jgi:precorrin-6B methylase 2